MGNVLKGRTIWQVPTGKLLAAVNLLAPELGEGAWGVVEVLGDRKGKEFREHAARFLLRCGIDVLESEKVARAMVGEERFWSIEEWARFYGEFISEKKICSAPVFPLVFPWGKEVLSSSCPLCGGVVRYCHSAFLGLDCLYGDPLTLSRWCELHRSYSEAYSEEFPRIIVVSGEPVSSERPFQDVTIGFRWYLLHQAIIPESRNRTYHEQRMLLPPEYEVPSAAVEAVKNTLLVLRSDRPKINTAYARCSDLTADGRHVLVGNFERTVRRFSVAVRPPGNYADVGLAASRRLPDDKVSSV